MTLLTSAAHRFPRHARRFTERRNGLHPFSEAARKFTSCKFPAALLFGENEVLKKTSCLAPKSQSFPKRDAARLGASLNLSYASRWRAGSRAGRHPLRERVVR